MTIKNPITADAFMRQLKAAMQFDVYDHLKEIQVPTLVMTGNEDILIPAENSRILSERVPGAILKIFESGGHGFSFQFSNEVAKVVKEFLQS